MFGDLNERQDEYLRDILSSGQHLLELLNEILDLSKVEAGRMELEPSTFSVPAALDYGDRDGPRTRDRAMASRSRLEVDPGLDLVESDELKLQAGAS